MHIYKLCFETHARLGSVDNSTIPAINPRFYALRFSHINNICCDTVLKNRRFLFGLANCQQTLVYKRNSWF